MIDLFDVDAAFMQVERNTAFASRRRRAARARKPDSGHTGTVSLMVRARRARWNAMKPRIHGVLTPWKPGSSAFGGGDFAVGNSGYRDSDRRSHVSRWGSVFRA